MGRLRGYKAAFRLERFRAAAEQLRVEQPELYQQILAEAEGSQAEGAAARDPDAYVALFLSEAAETGVINAEERRRPKPLPDDEPRFSLLGGIVILFRDGIPQLRWWVRQKRSKDTGPGWDAETLGYGAKKPDDEER